MNEKEKQETIIKVLENPEVKKKIISIIEQEKKGKIKTEPVRAEKQVVDRFRVLVKRKYGKLKYVMGEEMTVALEAHCKKLERELEEKKRNERRKKS